MEVGPRDQEASATVPVYANEGPALCEVIVHGVEIPSMLVCPAPVGPYNVHGERLSQPPAKPDAAVSTCLVYPSTCLPDVPGAYDFQVYVAEGDFAATGEVTMVPHADERQSGVWVPYGLEPSTWVEGHLLERLSAHYGDTLHEVLGAIAGKAAECCERAATEPKTEPTHEPICGRCDSDRPGPCEACTELATAVPDGGNGAPGVPVASEPTPEWLAEFMAELAARHSLRTPEGCEGAMTEAARMSDSFGFRCRSCASLARGYRAAGGALAAVNDEDENAWTRHSVEASRHFREAVDLARQGEAVGA